MHFDGKLVNSMRQLPRIVAGTSVGKAVDVEVWRQGKIVKLLVKLGEFPENPKKVTGRVPDATSNRASGIAVPELGMTLSTLTPALREKFKLKKSIDGVIVVQVTPAGPAAEKRIPPGAIIRKIGPDQTVVVSPRQVRTRVSEAKKAKSKTILVLIEMGGTQRFFVLNIAKV